jgi:uncharacterized membrane protein
MKTSRSSLPISAWLLNVRVTVGVTEQGASTGTASGAHAASMSDAKINDRMSKNCVTSRRVRAAGAGLAAPRG